MSLDLGTDSILSIWQTPKSICLTGFYLEHLSRGGNYARHLSSQGPSITGLVDEDMKSRKSGNFELRDISIQTLAEAIGKEWDLPGVFIWWKQRGEIKTLMLKDETPKWKTTRIMRRKIQKRWE